MDCKVMQVGKLADIGDGLKIPTMSAAAASRWCFCTVAGRAPARSADLLTADRTIRSE